MVTPNTRKRKRRSPIIEDEDDEGAEEQNSMAPTQVLDTPTRVLVLNENAQTTQQAKQQQAYTVNVDEDEDEDDEVEIIQTPAARSRQTGSATKRRTSRLSLRDSDDEEPSHSMVEIDETEKTQKLETTEQSAASERWTTPAPKESAESSTARRSTRIEHKRQQKEHKSVRKLTFRTLDNCLPHLQNTGSLPDEIEEASSSSSSSDEDVPAPSLKKKRVSPRPQPTNRRQTTSAFLHDEKEGKYADGGEDMDDFICADNEVEYMDDDDEGVIDVPSSGDDLDRDDTAEAEASVEMMTATRDQKEWFDIYIQYIERAIAERDLDTQMRRRPNVPQHVLFNQAMHHIERPLCARRDTVRGSVPWPAPLLDNLKRATKFSWSRRDPTVDCQACNRRNHAASYVVRLGGIAVDATGLYRDMWMMRLRKDIAEGDAACGSFNLGSTCFARVLAYWQLLHAKHFWVALVDSQMIAGSGRDSRRIPEKQRKAFIGAEYGRFQRLLRAVDTFEATDAKSKNGEVHMYNVWKKVESKGVQSEFLPKFPHQRSQDDSEDDDDGEEDEHDANANDSGDDDAAGDRHGRRRGAMDSFVAASDSEPEDVDEEEQQAEQAAAEMTATHEHSPGEKENSDTNAKVKPEAASETAAEVEDNLLCLVCEKEPRNGGVVHGRYLHYYCCYGCAKRQMASKEGCLLCTRPIENVLRLLPLSSEARQAIYRARRQLKHEI
ncbi:TPA: LOW QUALITY PROTEIN: hypothetical protein N0F65_008322 [Lagenidium giganteum]|uniref:DUF4211 domain-containing protein n=1 Tax=Lagenidium giganteum TaxID=4803 RepID=A0AAV2YSS4_9STRA|nr:TPA: LOW QUALITY PROTEIN: hypothetical protein N0F65_008322 [Lagenidium giganteum]